MKKGAAQPPSQDEQDQMDSAAFLLAKAVLEGARGLVVKPLDGVSLLAGFTVRLEP